MKQKVITEMKANIIAFLELVFGVFFLIGLYYIRLVPRISRDLWQNMTDRQLFLTLFVIFLILLGIYNLLNMLFGQYKPSIFNKIALKIQTVIISCFKAVYYFFWNMAELLVRKFDEDYDLYYNFMLFCIRWFVKKEFFITNTLILLAMRYLPKIILTLALFVDVIIYQRFHYTFKCIPLLLLPLVEKAIIGIFQDAWNKYFYALHKYVRIDVVSKTYSCHDLFFFYPPPYVKDFDDLFYNHFLPLRKLSATLQDYQFFCYVTNNIYLDLAMAFLRLFIYLYILNYGLN